MLLTMQDQFHEALSDDDLLFYRDRREELKAIDSWTPAMVSMAICGIQPVEGCTSIPDRGMSLTSPRLAKRRELENAQVVLKEWISFNNSDEQGNLFPDLDFEEILRTPVNIIQFCIDCDEAELNSRAQLLMEFLVLKADQESYLVKSANRVAEARDLKNKLELQEELFERLVNVKIKEDESGSAPLENVGAHSTTTAPPLIISTRTERGRRANLVTLIQVAEEAVGDQKNDVNILYSKMMELAEQDPGVCKGYTVKPERKGLYYKWADGDWMPYPKRYLKQRIIRRQGKMEK